MVGSPGRSGGSRKQGFDTTKADGGPVMPIGLSAAVADKWALLVGQIPGHVLRSVDGHQLETLARLLTLADGLWSRIESEPADIQARRLFLQSADRINRLSSQFGLSPSDRQRLRIEPAEDDENDEFIRWMREGERPAQNNNFSQGGN